MRIFAVINLSFLFFHISLYAQEVAEKPTSISETLMGFLPLIAIFVIFYFFMIRPQQKRMRQHQEMIQAIKRGDKVLTAGGIIGMVSKVDDDNVVNVEIAPDVVVKVNKTTISEVISRSEPIKTNDKSKSDK